MPRRSVWHALLTLGLVLTALANAAPPVRAAELPNGFIQSLYASGVNNPTAMAFAPDGRLFVLEQFGAVRVIKEGKMLPAPFITLDTDGVGERGLLGIAFDPAFAQNGYVYLYYTVHSEPRHNRVLRVTANGDVAAPGSETVIMELEPLSQLHTHNGGALHFGPDGKLYVAVGENGTPFNSQTLNNRLGKLLRVNPDGSIPEDNPFYASASGPNRAIWAFGFRNPFTFSIQAETGRIFVNDVGYDKWEEINDVERGASYGWPVIDGPQSDPYHRAPLYAYEHGGAPDQGCAVTAGAFYDKAIGKFPAEYANSYFFGDYCNNWIRRLDLETMQPAPFITGTEGGTIDIDFGPDGAMYYLARWSGNIYRVEYAPDKPPFITQRPADALVSVGQPASFTCHASGSPALAYQWQRGDRNIDGANQPVYTLYGASETDNGATFRCIVTNPFGSATSDPATLSVSVNPPPQATITAPAEGTLYAAGQTIQFAGAATDAVDGELPPSAYSWRVDFHREGQVYPFLPEMTGLREGSFTIPTLGETSTDVYYRIRLTARNNSGLTTTVFRDVRPRTARITVQTEPNEMQIKIDGNFFRAPVEFQSVVGITRNLQAITPQNWLDKTWVLKSWSDGGTATHDISTPEQDTVYTATFEAVPATNLAVSLTGAPEMPQPGQDITYTILLKNNGPEAEKVVLTSSLLANMTFKSMTPPDGWACETPAAGAKGEVSCSIDKLRFGEYRFALVVALDASARSGEKLVMTVSADSPSYDWYPNSRTGSTINLVK